MRHVERTGNRLHLRRAVLAGYFAALLTFAWCVVAFCSDSAMHDNGMGLGFLVVGAAGLGAFVLLLGCTAWLWFSQQLHWPLWLPLGAASAVLVFAFVSSALQSCSRPGAEAVPAVAPPPNEPAAPASGQ